MFDPDRFITDCRDNARSAPGVLDVVARAVSTPGEILAALGEPKRAGVRVLLRSDDLTVLNLVWRPDRGGGGQGPERAGDDAARA